MATELTVQQNQLVHTANFSRPVFELWGQGGTILGGLYGALTPFGIALADFRTDSASQNPMEQGITVNIGLRGIHRFKIDRLETSFFNFVDSDLPQIAAILGAATGWVRKMVAATSFASHQFIYSSHSKLVGIKIEEFLNFCPQKIARAGFGRGTGAIFHWDVPDKGWETHLLVDRSVIAPDGVFLMFTLAVKGDAIDYARLVVEGKPYLEDTLTGIGLKFST